MWVVNALATAAHDQIIRTAVPGPCRRCEVFVSSSATCGDLLLRARAWRSCVQKGRRDASLFAIGNGRRLT